VLVDVRIGESREVRVDLVVDPSSQEAKGAPLPLWPGLLVGGVGLVGARAAGHGVKSLSLRRHRTLC